MIEPTTQTPRRYQTAAQAVRAALLSKSATLYQRTSSATSRSKPEITPGFKVEELAKTPQQVRVWWEGVKIGVKDSRSYLLIAQSMISDVYPDATYTEARTESGPLGLVVEMPITETVNTVLAHLEGQAASYEHQRAYYLASLAADMEGIAQGLERAAQGARRAAATIQANPDQVTSAVSTLQNDLAWLMPNLGAHRLSDRVVDLLKEGRWLTDAQAALQAAEASLTI